MGRSDAVRKRGVLAAPRAWARVGALSRYFTLLAIQLRASALLAMQYRLDFVLDGFMSLFWTGSALVPLLVLFGQRSTVAGWTWPEALLVVGWFTLLKGVLDGAIQPALQNVVEHIRKGTLDFLLIKPVDAQFMVSTSRFELYRGSDVFGGLFLLGWAVHRLDRWPSLGGVALAGMLLVGLAFFVVKVDNLSYLFSSIYDAARWPSSVFRGALAFVFTFVIPLALMTTYPALAILDRLSAWRAFAALGGAAMFAFAARRVWVRAMGHYTSAGG
jgi:ABC-2 type transport system permease protein